MEKEPELSLEDVLDMLPTEETAKIEYLTGVDLGDQQDYAKEDEINE